MSSDAAAVGPAPEGAGGSGPSPSRPPGASFGGHDVVPSADEDRLLGQVGELLGRVGGRPARDEAAAVAAGYRALDRAARRRVLRALADRYGVDRVALDAAVERWRAAEGTDAMAGAAEDLRRAAAPSYRRLLHPLTGIESGVPLLLELRADLRAAGGGDPGLAALDRELAEHLRTVFAVGLLELRRLTWDDPAAVLEKIVQHEAVHPLASWTDLRDRLDADRRCYAFVHPALPGELVVFVEVALTLGMASRLPDILDEEAPVLDPGAATAATFYSITNTQPGLAGVNLGTDLLVSVVDRLSSELPGLRDFATLSPIPGFRAWVEEVVATDALRPGERALLPPDGRLRDVDPAAGRTEGGAHAEALRPALTALCARYLTTARPNGKVIDPVGNFHLANGAAVERVDWLADPSPEGISSSLGLMVNYRYDPERLAARAAAYAAGGAVPVAEAVRVLLA